MESEKINFWIKDGAFHLSYMGISLTRSKDGCDEISDYCDCLITAIHVDCIPRLLRGETCKIDLLDDPHTLTFVPRGNMVTIIFETENTVWFEPRTEFTASLEEWFRVVQEVTLDVIQQMQIDTEAYFMIPVSSLIRNYYATRALLRDGGYQGDVEVLSPYRVNQMFRSQMRGNVLKNIPGLPDENGKVHEQTVIIELEDRTVLHVNDSDMISKDERLGSRTIGISAKYSQIEKIAFPEKGVKSLYLSPEDVTCADKETVLYSGEVLWIDKKQHSLFVDIGLDTIEADFCQDEMDSINNYKIGDYVRVKSSQNDLTGVWDLYDAGGFGWIHIVHNHVNTPSGNQFLSFGPEYKDKEKIKDLIQKGAKNGVEIKKNRYHYVEPNSGKTLHLIIADDGDIVTASPHTGFAVINAMKENLRIPVQILDLKPDTEYMDRVYTQLVLVEFADGTQASVFDDDMLCTPEMVEKNGKIVLSMLVTSLEKNETRDQTAYMDSSMPALEINGQIDEIIIPSDPKNAERWHDAVVDFGFGKILIQIDKKYSHLHLKEGDGVRVDGRVDLKDIQ